jgi:hypothetical protein
VKELISLCAGLPLALSGVTARAATHPEMPLAALSAEIGRGRETLDVMETGENATSVREAFSWSRATLSEDAEWLFRLLAGHRDGDITLATAVSTSGLPWKRVYLALAELTDENLVAEHMPGRYVCHELLRSYAGELVRERDTGAY